MGDPITTALITAAVGIGSQAASRPRTPAAADPPPQIADVPRTRVDDLTRRRALAGGGRRATLLTDDTGPNSGQVPRNQIGRATLLGG